MKKLHLNGLSGIISQNSNVRSGRPCFKDTRIPVDYVIKHLMKGWDLQEVGKLFPELKKEDIKKAFDHKSLFV